MGHGGGGRKRARQAREVALVAGAADSRAKAAAERRALGTEVSVAAPSAALFVEDRARLTKADIRRQEHAVSKKSTKRAVAPRARKSERGANAPGAAALPLQTPGRKAKRLGVDAMIVKKRSFVSAAVKNSALQAAAHKERVPVEEDVWTSKLAEQVAAAKSKERERVETIFNAPVREKVHVLAPDNGISINPLHEAHQDALGEAVAAVIAKRDVAEWEANQLKFDPAVLLEDDIHVADDMDDDGDDTVFDGEEDAARIAAVAANAAVQERKTRRDKNRASRRRTAEALRVRKLIHARISDQIANFDQVSAVAEVASRRLAGEMAAARKEELQKILAADGVEANQARALHRVLGGEKVPTEKDAAHVPLSSELSENMRSVGMPITNPLIRDRFLAFQRRGVIEPVGVIRKEAILAKKEKIRFDQSDKRIRKGRGSKSNSTYWIQRSSNRKR
jgi:Nop53 (60S ribosomal biogenesis)